MNQKLYLDKGKRKRSSEMTPGRRLLGQRMQGKLKNRHRGYQHGSRMEWAWAERIRFYVGFRGEEKCLPGECAAGQSTVFMVFCCLVSVKFHQANSWVPWVLGYAYVGCLVFFVLICLVLNYKGLNSKQELFLPQRCIELVRHIKSYVVLV